MPTLENVIRDMPEPQYNDVTLIKNQSTHDIIRELIKSHQLYGHQGDNIQHHFKGSDNKVVNDLYKFMSKEFIYKVEPDTFQSSRSPSRIIWDSWDGKSLDCKGYALFSSSILASKNIPYKFRFVSYNPSSSDPHHVYTMAKVNNKWLHIDPLQKSPKEIEKKYIFVKDYKINPMALKRLSGIGVSKFRQALLKVPLSANRTAFLQAVRKNIANLGGRVARAYQKNPSMILNWWKGLGGSTSSLINAMNKVPVSAIKKTGIPVPPPNTPERKAYCKSKYPRKLSLNRPLCNKGIIRGIGDPTVIAILSASAPVIASLTPLLKQLGIGKGDNSEYENYVEAIEVDTTPQQAGIPLPLLLIGGGILASLLLFGKK